jgi:hypothetical protein
MKVYRRAAAALGTLLVLPLVVAVAWSFGFTATCEHDCGDTGGRGLIDPESGHEPALFWLVVATVLAAMATTAVLALRAAWRKRR